MDRKVGLKPNGRGHHNTTAGSKHAPSLRNAAPRLQTVPSDSISVSSGAESQVALANQSPGALLSPPRSQPNLPAANQTQILALQRTVGNQMVQRLIIHDRYNRPTDTLKTVKDQLETEETVTALKEKTGQDDDLYEGGKPLDHPDNYIIGHGAAGLAISFTIDQAFVNQLVDTRKLQSGDHLCLIVCGIGAKGGEAEILAHLIGLKGIKDVVIHAPQGFINWNKEGPVVVSSYPDHPKLKEAAKAYSQVEDKAWQKYIGTLKSSMADITDDVIKSGKTPDLLDAIKTIIDREPSKTKDDHTKRVARLKAEKDSQQLRKGCQALLQELQPAEQNITDRASREKYQAEWSETLKTLLASMYEWQAGAREQGKQNYDVKLAKVQGELREALKAGWYKYSKEYFDILWTVYNDDWLWRRLISDPQAARELEQAKKMQTAHPSVISEEEAAALFNPTHLADAEPYTTGTEEVAIPELDPETEAIIRELLENAAARPVERSGQPADQSRT